MEGKELKQVFYQIIITVACLALNIAGSRLAADLNLPMWLDSAGTVFAAYMFGPYCGILLGIGTNIITSILYDTWPIYAITSAAIGLITGWMARKKVLESFFGAMCLSTALTAASLAVSLPLNVLTSDSMSGNIWGDAVIDYLGDRGIGSIRFLIGQYYVEFVDKTTVVLILYFTIRLFRFLRSRKSNAHALKNTAAVLLAVLASLGMLFSAASPVHALSEDDSSQTDGTQEDYRSYTQTVYDGSNGLPCGEANAIAATSDGALWIGTYAGLYRYTGQQFRHMDDFSSVKNVNCLYTDAEGRLWIGTNDSGLAIAIGEEVVNVITKDDGLPSDSVRSIGGGYNGLYYVGTSSGLVLVSLESGLHVLKSFSQRMNVISIDADGAGHAACVTDSGGICYLVSDEIKDTYSSDEEAITSVSFTPEGDLLAGTAAGHLLRFSVSDEGMKEQETWYLDGVDQINDIFITEKTGDVFACTDDGIVVIQNNGTFFRLQTGTFSNSIEDMAADYQGNLWFASSRMGLLRLSFSGVHDLFQKAGLSEAVVNAVAQWQGDLYCGTDEGLVIINPEGQGKTTELTEAMQGIRIRSLCAKDDALWISTDGKGTAKAQTDGTLTFFDSSSGAFGNKSRVVIRCGDDIAAAGTGGLSLFHSDGTMTTVHTPAGAARILCLSVLEDGTILAGTDGDGIAVVRNGRVERYLTRKNGLSSDIVLKIPVNNGDVYAVCSNGICFMNGTASFTPLDAFPYSNNYDIIFSQSGKAFIPGSAGIYVVDAEVLKKNQEDMDPQLLDADWGFVSALTANAWNCLDASENCYLASNRGVYGFSLQKYDSNDHSYRITVSTVQADGTQYTLEKGTTLNLDRKTGKLSFQPEIINFTSEDPDVSCQLAGYDRNPVIMPLSALSDITYTNLPPGSYTFVVSVLGRGNGLPVDQTQVPLTIEEAFYDHQYFLVYFFGIAAASIAWLTWLIFRTQFEKTIRIQRQQVELARNQVRMSNETIMTIARTLDARDLNTSMHSERVAEYSVMIARKMGFSEAECENLRKAALLHDIGKIGVPDAILNKPSRLTDEEYAIMKTHVTKGAEILKNFTGIDHVVEGALYHHERYDGHGYVHGLKGKDIPLYGRIIGVADAFDAMTANRVYRKQLDIEYVKQELVRCSGTQFDPEIADIMLALVVSGEVNVEEIYHSKQKENEA